MPGARGENAKVKSALYFQAGFEVTQLWVTQMLVRAFWGFFENCFHIDDSEIKGFQIFTCTKKKAFPKLLGDSYVENRKDILM